MKVLGYLGLGIGAALVIMALRLDDISVAVRLIMGIPGTGIVLVARWWLKTIKEVEYEQDMENRGKPSDDS